MGVYLFAADPLLRQRPLPFKPSRLTRPNSHGQTYPNDANKVGHPCAKPIRMWQWLVERSSLPRHDPA